MTKKGFEKVALIMNLQQVKISTHLDDCTPRALILRRGWREEMNLRMISIREIYY